MAKKNEIDDTLINVEEAYSKTEQYIEDNKKPLTIIVTVVVLAIAGYFGYTKFYLAPLEEEAQISMFKAQEYFEADNYTQALNGDGVNAGFLEIIEDFGGTKAANLAHYYAGVSYLNTGDFQAAIEELDKFSSSDEIIAVEAKGAIGDAFMELGQTKDGYDYYVKAINLRDNSFITPIYLKKAAIAAEELGEYDKALKHYNTIKQKYPNSQMANDIEKYIAYAEAKAAN